MVEVNIGKSYLTVVDLDEYEKGFYYSTLEGVDSSSAGISKTPSSSVPVDNEVEIGEETGAEPSGESTEPSSTDAELIYSESAS